MSTVPSYELRDPCPFDLHPNHGGGICGQPTYCTTCGGCLWHCIGGDAHEPNDPCHRCRVVPHRDGSTVCQRCDDITRHPSHIAKVRRDTAAMNGDVIRVPSWQDTRNKHSNDLDGVA